MIDQYDNEEIYCRKLGHHLRFHYCRTEHDGNPCPLIFDCWHEKLAIGAYMRDNFNPQDVEYLVRPKPDKMVSLLELIQRAQKRASE